MVFFNTDNEYYQTLLQRCSNVIWQQTTLQQRYLATFFPLSLNVVTQRWGNVHNFHGLRFHNFHSLLWKRCYNLKLLAGRKSYLVIIIPNI